VVGTLRHVEIDLEVEPTGSERSFPMARDQHPVPQPRPEPEERHQESQTPWRRREPRIPVPAGDGNPDSQADGAAGAGH
jgi:hypothetical protein